MSLRILPPCFFKQMHSIKFQNRRFFKNVRRQNSRLEHRLERIEHLDHVLIQATAHRVLHLGLQAIEPILAVLPNLVVASIRQALAHRIVNVLKMRLKALRVVVALDEKIALLVVDVAVGFDLARQFLDGARDEGGVLHTEVEGEGFERRGGF